MAGIGRVVRVTAEDVMCATNVASLQMLRKVQNGRGADHGGVSNRGLRLRWADTMHGLIGEIALARALDRAWTPGGFEVSIGDVGGCIEVRSTERLDGHLLLYDRDRDDGVFALMVGHYPAMEIRGFVRAWRGKDHRWWNSKADPPCFWVPQSGLMELTEAMGDVHGTGVEGLPVGRVDEHQASGA